MTEWDFILQNKPVVIKTGNISLEMSLGYMLEGTTWFSQEQYDQLPDITPIPWHKIKITVFVNDQVIFKSSIDGVVLATHIFEDSDNVQHTLTVNLDGINDQHRPRWPSGLSGGAMLKIHNITIEDMSMEWGMPTLGTYVLEDGSVHIPTSLAGSNGTQTLPFSTPIYSWLIANHQAILNR